MEPFDWRSLEGVRELLDKEDTPLMLMDDGTVVSPISGNLVWSPPLPRSVLIAPSVDAEDFGKLVDEYRVYLDRKSA